MIIMNMREIFESTFDGKEKPKASYIVGNDYKVFVIAKYDITEDDTFFLYVLEPKENKCISLRADKFEELMNIVKMLTYSFSTVYFES